MKYKYIKLLYWTIFNRKRYRNYFRFNKIILKDRCQVHVPPAFINSSYHYFSMDLIDKDWKKEEIMIQSSNETSMTENI